jgi:hypothetical protein
MILPISTSQVARITGMSHRFPALDPLYVAHMRGIHHRTLSILPGMPTQNLTILPGRFSLVLSKKFSGKTQKKQNKTKLESWVPPLEFLSRKVRNTSFKVVSAPDELARVKERSWLGLFSLPL